MSGLQRAATVLSAEPVAAYRHLVLAAPELVAAARPGQFAALAVGDRPTAMLLRRAFSLYDADPGRGTVELVVAADGPGSRWVTTRRPGDLLDVLAPLGRPFPPPPPGGRCVLVGGGYGSAPLLWWARELKTAGHDVALVIGAAGAGRLFGAQPAAALGIESRITTDDGSAGRRGRVTDELPALLPGAAAVYACGPMAMLRAVGSLAAEHGLDAWLTVEEAMACGIGVCMTCVLPVRQDGATRMRRSCVAGPTFASSEIRWDAVRLDAFGARSLVPDDCVGAPGGGH